MTDGSQIYLFEFRGRAEIGYKEGPEEEVVSILNTQSEIIAREIEQEIRRVIPPGVNVETQIRFYAGSLEWEGIILLLDWAARLAGTVEFVGMFKKVAQVAIERVLQRWLISRNRIPIGPIQLIDPISIDVIAPNETAFLPRRIEQRSREVDLQLVGIALSLLNTILLMAILIVQLVYR